MSPSDFGAPEPRRIIAIATVAPLWGIHYGTDLEIAVEHIARGDEVHVLTCRGGLRSCVANPAKDRIACIFCRSIQRRAIASLGISPTHVHVLPRVRPRNAGPFDSFAGLRDHGADHGQTGSAAASSLVSYLRDPEPDIRRHGKLADSMLASAEVVYDWTSGVLRSIGADQLYVFNGRFVNALPAVTAARDAGVRVTAHERNWNGSGFVTRDSGSVHDLAEYAELMHAAEHAVAVDRAARSHAVQWFEGRRFPLGETRIQSFTARQLADRLPDGFHRSARNVAAFVSSEDEFVALAEWKHALFDSQEETLLAIATAPELAADVILWVRVHPNLAGLMNAQTARLEELAALGPANLRVIAADSEVDSYALAESADMVITFGSTIGAEAVYWGTPVMLLGRATYEAMEGVMRPTSLSEILHTINRGLPRPHPELALAFGSMMTEAGHQHVAFSTDRPTSPGSLHGRPLTPSVGIRAIVKLAYIARRSFRRLRPRRSIAPGAPESA